MRAAQFQISEKFQKREIKNLEDSINASNIKYVLARHTGIMCTLLWCDTI